MKRLFAILIVLALLLCALSASAEAGSSIPEALMGEWTGVGTPKNGGPAIDLTATINGDGSGEYTFDQGGYHESYPFTISSDDSAFSVDIPADNTLGISACGGTWALEDGVLKLDITTTFANGGSYAYTAECEKAAEGKEGRSSAPAGEDAPAEAAQPSSTPLGDPIVPQANAPTLAGAESTEPTPEPTLEPAAENYRHADAGQTRVEWNGGEESFELELFASQWTNWDLLVNTIGLMPGSGTYLFILRLHSLVEPLTYDRIKEEIAPTLALRCKADGTQDLPKRVILPFDAEDGAPVWRFDLTYVFQCDGDEDDFELLYDGVLYPLSGLPKEGYALTVPTPSPTPELTPEPTSTPVPADIVALNELHRRALNENGTSIDKAVCTGDVVVAYYSSGSEDANPSQILTADSDDTWGFPREYRADDFESARWAAIIYPTYVHVGWYGNIAAHRTNTWLSLFDLETGVQYKEMVVSEEPPLTLTVQTANGITQSSEASGQFHAADARVRLTELVEAARVASPPASTPEPTLEPAGEASIDEVLTALNDDTYRATRDALRSGEVVKKGSKGAAARGVQQTLAAFGQKIAVDGNAGARTIAALNAVQAAFGLEKTDSLDAEGYATLLPRLLMVTDPDAADALLAGRMDRGEYDHMRGCALAAQGKYASAKALFEESGWGDWEARAGACVQPWPKTGVLYRNPAVKGGSAELAVQFNTDPDTAMLVKIYTVDGVLARTMFIGGTGRAKTSLPAGTYIIKDGTGRDWYGDEEAFGSEGRYEIMTFGNGQQALQLRKNYSSTITVNVQENNPDAEGVGSQRESWSDF
ncbi:MAG: hypothetical protein IKD53_09835 [Clostridia bacterium]|nr:hypothetical protein [Clostridia bacterium]